MDLSFYEFVGDGIGNDDIVQEVNKRLEEKYKKKFVAKRIGDRFGKDEDDIAFGRRCFLLAKNMLQPNGSDQGQGVKRKTGIKR